MKSKITLLIIFSIWITSIGYTQTPKSAVGGGEFVFNPNKTPCLTSEQRISFKRDVKSNIKTLAIQNKLLFSKSNMDSHPLFIWPIKKANHVNYNDVWSVSGYVDHNVSFPNQLTDYNCGTRTYDTDNGYNHQGVDIYLWPFQWKLMDESSVEIIAAAPGQIISKSEGNFDQSCDFNTTTPWNAIFVQHSDGSVAIYGHMKNGTVTSKNVGDMVETGEYLGVVGSSGVSTGPHLHFEVYTNDSFTTLVDPFSGTCNNMNTESWWANQKPYHDSNINALMTHSAAPDVFPSCPTIETTYESNDFDIAEDIYLSVFLRDQIANTSLNLKVIRPDGSYLYNWAINVGTTASSWYYYWFFPVDTVGEWTWEATYEGHTESHKFNVTSALSVTNSQLKNTSIYPNPANGLVHINSVKKIVKVEILDVTGKTIIYIQQTTQGIENINTSSLSNGLYFLRLEGDYNERKTIKFIKA
ncbi:peptidoglycan DD-metalloendopeptidase family protein [Algibacter sp. R77976]|uniref:peptidoglycan DD-metalloendopeptidase family protein n=1 Tax=Algibacter sp. R77976 TaxID=3093873 RepID=UPI0037C69556